MGLLFGRMTGCKVEAARGGQGEWAKLNTATGWEGCSYNPGGKLFVGEQS